MQKPIFKEARPGHLGRLRADPPDSEFSSSGHPGVGMVARLGRGLAHHHLRLTILYTQLTVEVHENFVRV